MARDFFVCQGSKAAGIATLFQDFANAGRGKKTRQELDAMMAAETWFPVQEAVAVGLVDGILYDEGGILASQVVNCVGAGIRTLASLGGLPDGTQMI